MVHPECPLRVARGVYANTGRPKNSAWGGLFSCWRTTMSKMAEQTEALRRLTLISLLLEPVLLPDLHIIKDVYSFLLHF